VVELDVVNAARPRGDSLVAQQELRPELLRGLVGTSDGSGERGTRLIGCRVTPTSAASVTHDHHSPVLSTESPLDH